MERLVTDIFLVTSKENDFHETIIDTTIQGKDANLWESFSWRSKSRRFIGYSRKSEDEYVVTDIMVFPEDKDDAPEDYAAVLLAKDSNEKGLKKHLLYYRRDSRKTASRAVEQINVINQSKGELVPPQFTAVGCAVNDLLIVYKTADIPTHPKRPPPAVPNLTIANNQQSFNNLPTSPIASYGLEGVPFKINPKYDSSINNDPFIGSLSVYSEDFSKYSYSFTTEKKVIERSQFES